MARHSDDGLDVWVVKRELADPALYAEARISDGGRPARAGAEAWYRACWMTSRPATPPMRRLDEVHGRVPGTRRDVLAAGLTGHDALGRAGAHQDLQALPGTRPVVAVGVRESLELDPGAVDPRPVPPVDTRRRGRVVDASTALAGLVGACDGELTVGQVVGALADLLEEPEPDLRARLLPAVRGLVAEGLLVLP